MNFGDRFPVSSPYLIFTYSVQSTTNFTGYYWFRVKDYAAVQYNRFQRDCDGRLLKSESFGTVVFVSETLTT